MWLCVYMDNIPVTGKTDEQHLKILEEVLGRLKKAGMWANKAKCFFIDKSVTYLGYSDGIHPLQEKVKAVKDAPELKNVTEL